MIAPNRKPTGQIYAEDFDRLLNASFNSNMDVTPTGNPNIYLITSRSNPNILHRTTVAHCSCQGHQRYGHCSHRCRLIFELGNEYIARWASHSKEGGTVDWIKALTPEVDTAAA